MGNIVLVLFNLLPIFPMDGGRVVRALLALLYGNYQATRIAVYLGFVLAVLLGMAGYWFGHGMTPILALFIIFVGQQELLFARVREYRQRMHDEGIPEVLPVPHALPRMHMPQAPVLMMQPTISVYTWDNNTGTWRQEPSAPA